MPSGIGSVIANPSDEVNLKRVINTPTRGISDSTVKAIEAHSVAQHMSFFEVLHAPLAVAAAQYASGGRGATIRQDDRHLARRSGA